MHKPSNGAPKLPEQVQGDYMVTMDENIDVSDDEVPTGEDFDQKVIFVKHLDQQINIS